MPLLLALTLASACGDAAGPTTDPLEVLGGDRQSGVVGTTLPLPLEVRATDGQGGGLAGVTIRFTVERGGGSVEPREVVTDERGRAATRWTLGTTSGEHRLSVEIEDGESIIVRATALPGPAVTIRPRRDTIVAFLDDTLTAAVVARDEFGNPITGRLPSWSVAPPERATISAEGVITSMEPGEAVLIAELDGVRAEVPLILTRWAALAPGYAHTCGVTLEGRAYCWGGRGYGGLVDVTGSGSHYPVPVNGNLRFMALTAGNRHTCGLTTEGVAYCWGDNASGQLGSSVPGVTSTPQPVAGGMRFSAIAAGGAHTCALTPAGEAYCWGSNESGQLGTGDRSSSLVPVPVRGGGFAALDGHGEHHCGLAGDGSVHCWGMIYDHGSLGAGSVAWFVIRESPDPLPGGTRFRRIAVERFHGCGLTDAGDALCWGDNGFGQLGSGDRDGSSAPVAVKGGLVFQTLSAGAFHTCGLTADGAAYCWGFGTWGQLGTESEVPDCGSKEIRCALTPVRVAGEHVFTAIAAGYTHTCGITDRGAAYCWGFNLHDQTGSGKRTVHEPTPVRVPSPR